MLIKLFAGKNTGEVAAALQTTVQTNHFGAMQVHNLKATLSPVSMLIVTVGLHPMEPGQPRL